MRQLAIPLGAAIVVVLAACQAATGSSDKPAAAPALADPASAAPLSDTERAAASLAIDALADELEIPKDRITVESVSAIEWRDSSLGCPKPGMAYLDVVTTGHKVLLKVDDATYAVHEAKGRAFVCAQPKQKVTQVTGGQLAYGSLMLAAQSDLAARLGVPIREIRPGGAERRVWEDASLGCPEPGIQYAQVLTEGWVIKLRHGGREFTYHADADRTIPCPAIATR